MTHNVQLLTAVTVPRLSRNAGYALRSTGLG